MVDPNLIRRLFQTGASAVAAATAARVGLPSTRAPTAPSPSGAGTLRRGALERNEFAVLESLINERFGGDAKHFDLPDLRGRVLAEIDPARQRFIGDTSGAAGENEEAIPYAVVNWAIRTEGGLPAGGVAGRSRGIRGRLKLAPGEGWGRLKLAPGEGTRPSRPRPWQAVALAETAEGAGSDGRLTGAPRIRDRSRTSSRRW